MLYVFIVPTGTTLNFDMNLAVKKVLELKNEIYQFVHIAVEDQVLLCSGGEELKSENIVGNYSGAGTDTNPIFLFSRKEISLPFSDKTSIDLTIEIKVKDCANMKPSITSITVRRSLAQQLAELSSKGKKECSDLVHQQHLQQQGWAAVIANLEDAKDCVIKRKHHLDELFENFLANRYYYQDTIKMFPEDIALLSKVPVLTKLLVLNESECSKEDLEKQHTLLTWFCSEPQHVLESLVEKCQHSLDNLHENSLIFLNSTFMEVIEQAGSSDYREVKGIEKRLSSLNHISETTGKLCKDQNELITTLESSDRINQARDPNVLPDVCTWYQSQLELMLKNYKPIGDMLSKCKAAKIELSLAINCLIPRICKLESEIFKLHRNIGIYENYVKSVINKIESFHQVHLAPQRYLKTLAEVCRRKEFSTNFIKWATELSEKASKLYEKEISLRKDFNRTKSKNMVDNLFRGMDDMPPPYAVECPRPFDQNLPDVSKEDLDQMKALFPNLAQLCEVLPPDPMPCISQVESDSAFSSNIPSSLKISSLETSHSNILKVHAKISTLQKFIQELQGTLQSDLSHLKEFVKDELTDRMTDASDIVEKINSCVAMMHTQMLMEKEEAVTEAKKDFVSIENAYRHRLEVESQKLNDAENQIAHYEEHLRAVSSSYEEGKHENEQLVNDLQDKKELLKKIMLEHELEFDSFKIQMTDIIQNKDSKIAELQQALSDALCEVTKLKQEKIDEQTEYNKSLQRKQAMIDEQQLNQKILQEKLDKLQESVKHSKELKEVERKLEETLREKRRYQQVSDDSLRNLLRCKEDAEKSRKSALKELEEKLASKHKNDMESLRSRFRLAVSTTYIERSSSSPEPPTDAEAFVGMEDLRKEMTESRRKLKEEKERAIAKLHKEMLEEQKQALLKQEQENKKVIAYMQSEHEEAMEKLKSRITAESQVSFNEAINSVAREKDVVIEELRSQVTILDRELFNIKSHLQKYLPPRDSLTQSHSGSLCVHMEAQRAEETRVVESLFQQEGAMSISHQLTQSRMEAHENVKKKHKAKEASQQVQPECYRPWTYPCLDCKNKISIFTCTDGDLVLLRYEERHQNFAVFHFGAHAHFLHSDSLQSLDLKLPLEKTAEGTEDSPKKWVLGIVITKEFCITKKKENRYKVTQGTKFYRVKVRPWDRETALSVHQFQQTTQMTATICGTTPPDPQPPSSEGNTRSDMSQSTF